MTRPGPGRALGRGSSGSARLLAGGLVAFALTHAVYLACGIRYQAPLERYWEYVDPTLLTTRLLESLVYLHSQPPLFNLYLGAVLKLFPASHALAFHAVSLLCGLALYLATLALMRRLDVAPGLAFALATAFMASPTFVLYEHLLFYMLPIALLVALGPLALHAGLRRSGAGRLVGFFALVATLCALQSVFHLAYYVAVVATVVALCPGRRRRLLGASLPPLLALVLLYAKNLYLFGILTTSSWSGMHLADMTTEFLPPAERARLVAEGRLPPVALIRPFSPIEAYAREDLAVPAWAETVPVLAAAHRADGGTSYHFFGYLEISRRYRDAALWTALHRPATVVRATARAWAAYFRPAADYFGLEPNRSRIDAARRLEAEIVDGRALWPRRWPPGPEGPGVFLVVGLPALWLLGARAVARGRAGTTPLTAPQRAILGLMCLEIAYVALVVNSLTAGENHRFRFVTDPLSVVLLALVVDRWLRPALGSWRRPR